MKKLIFLLAVVLCAGFVLATQACHRRHDRERYDDQYQRDQHQHYPARPGY